MADSARVVPLRREPPKRRHADDLYQVLRDLVSMARLSAPICCADTFSAAVRNADELLKHIDREATEDLEHEKQTDRSE